MACCTLRGDLHSVPGSRDRGRGQVVDVPPSPLGSTLSESSGGGDGPAGSVRSAFTPVRSSAVAVKGPGLSQESIGIYSHGVVSESPRGPHHPDSFQWLGVEEQDSRSLSKEPSCHRRSRSDHSCLSTASVHGLPKDGCGGQDCDGAQELDLELRLGDGGASSSRPCSGMAEGSVCAISHEFRGLRVHAAAPDSPPGTGPSSAAARSEAIVLQCLVGRKRGRVMVVAQGACATDRPDCAGQGPCE